MKIPLFSILIVLINSLIGFVLVREVARFHIRDVVLQSFRHHVEEVGVAAEEFRRETFVDA